MPKRIRPEPVDGDIDVGWRTRKQRRKCRSMHGNISGSQLPACPALCLPCAARKLGFVL